MRPVTVRRFSVALFVGLLLAAIAFGRIAGWNAAPPADLVPPPHAGARALFDHYCGGCHSAEDLRPRVAAMDGRQPAALEAFLNDHGDAPPEADRLIADYLRSR